MGRIGSRRIEESDSRKQYGFQGENLELYIKGGSYCLNIWGDENWIDGGAFNCLLEKIGGLNPEDSEKLIRELFSEGKIKKA